LHDRVKAIDMNLRELIEGLKIKKLLGSEDIKIVGISHDSNQVRDGFLFAAIVGDSADGHKFIGKAFDRGAKALLVEHLDDCNFENVTTIQVEDSRSSLALISSNFYKHPSKELRLIGITGTNGKTTITYILESIFSKEGKTVGVLGTVEHRYPGKKITSDMTTPESTDLMALLRDMRSTGVEYVVMEVSSHALDKKRVLGCHFDAVVFTNLSQDHLDYHESLENYFQAKKRLFSEVIRHSEKQPIYSVINIDDQYGRKLVKESAGEIITYSRIDRSATVFAENADFSPHGIRAQLITPWGSLELNSNLFGHHNMSNLVAAAATALSLGVSKSSVETGIQRISTIPGRLEKVQNPLDITVVVDYAHTPDALRNVLEVTRGMTQGDLILVFGCGGDRDPLKRPIMGSIGRQLSDILIVTSDNPRTESPEKIIDQIEKGIYETGFGENRYFRISDRQSAIEKAIEIARKGDLVLIAGKGHEDYQLIGTKKIPFDDKEIARNKVQGMMG